MLDKTTYILTAIFLSFSLLLGSCDKVDDTSSVQGRWEVTEIMYTRTMDDGSIVTKAMNHCDMFWVGDIVTFDGTDIIEGETGTEFYSMFSGYPGSIQYSIKKGCLYIPEQVFPDLLYDDIDGWTCTLTITVGEWSLPYSLQGDSMIIRHEGRGWSDAETYEHFYCDVTFVLNRAYDR